jgi:hypothetical protein
MIGFLRSGRKKLLGPVGAVKDIKGVFAKGEKGQATRDMLMAALKQRQSGSNNHAGYRGCIEGRRAKRKHDRRRYRTASKSIP